MNKSKAPGKSQPRKKKPSIEQEIIDALADFSDALEKNQVQERLTCRQIKLDLEPGAYGPALVKKTREILGLSQSLFARFLGTSPNTIRAWEQGVNTPQPMACRFMDEIRRDPRYWRERLRAASVSGATRGTRNPEATTKTAI